MSQALPETLASLGPMLDDRHPGVRRYACESPRPGRRCFAPRGGARRGAADAACGRVEAGAGRVAAGCGSGTKPSPDRLLALLDAPRPEARGRGLGPVSTRRRHDSPKPISASWKKKSCLAGGPCRNPRRATGSAGTGDRPNAILSADAVLRRVHPQGRRWARQAAPPPSGRSGISMPANRTKRWPSRSASGSSTCLRKNRSRNWSAAWPRCRSAV